MNLTLRQTVSYSHAQDLLSRNCAILFLLSVLINFSLGYDFSPWDAIGFFCFLCLLEGVSRRAMTAVLIACTLTAAFYFPFGRAYGPPNFNTILSLYSTNPEEAGEILRVFPFWHYLVSLGILALGWLALRRPVRRFPRWSFRHTALLLVAAALFLLAPLENLRAGGHFSLLDTHYPVVRFVKDVVNGKSDVDAELRRMQALANLQDSWHVSAVKPQHQVYVLVIGESARRDALGAFGGQWDNTPFISHVNGVLFRNYLSAASSTQKSLGLTLTLVGNDAQPQYQNNIITLAKRAGFRTYWFSNQGQLGRYDTAIASIARRADDVRFLKNGDFEADEATQDGDLLKFTPDALNEETHAPKLIVYHLMGSHPKACARTHHQYATYVDTEEISCYLYSMTQTDAFLGTLYRQLKTSGQDFSMIYFSDHGLAFKERGTRDEYLAHDDQYQQNFQVPMFIASGDSTRHRVINAMRSANDFLPLFSEWSGIHSREIVHKYRFVSEQPASPIYVTNFALKRTDYARLAQDPFVTRPAAPRPTAGR
ncbi:phosphoethanolamine transferase [Enterobacillus tribolii]|uniref:Glucan phosphoethanolaminetransferase (Alkaline phosphatase superfamily) n=1 Tax=Enterobacillus tribolii TaxID=1487935 RepID=A0A370R4W5_9GAMM|nr:sulfatase-like hydrolase/transferase [Enterobacillus tribolii]MBW7983411.1 phosphoethanolamine transferase [Enterobacillus tribolii]RDK97471.1 glucan phosphoethanolaminetransferase (alkaline phosphatase superfamily) [Enterobacillus tribolii]